MGKVNLKEKTTGYLLLTINIIFILFAINISLGAILYSIGIGRLSWGIISVLMIWILIFFVSGIVIMILNYLGLFHLTALSDLVSSNVKILGKKDDKIHGKIVIITTHNIVFIEIISIAILVYSLYTQTLLWGIIIVDLIMILISLLLSLKILLIARPHTTRSG